MLTAIWNMKSIVLGGAFTVLTAIFLGQVLFALLGITETFRDRLERTLFSFALGAACLSTFVFYLCAAQLVYDASFFALVAGVGAAYWHWVWRRRRATVGQPGPGGRLQRDPLFWTAVSAGAFYAVLYMVHGLAPEITWDGVAYHLGLVKRYYDLHGFPALTTTIYSFLSQGAEMLYLMAYAFGRHSAAKLVHVAFAAATVAAILSFARRSRMEKAGLVAALLFLCAPVVVRDATSTYNDCALAFFAFMTFYGLQVFRPHLSLRTLWVLGVIGGFGFAIKYTGFVAAALVVAVVAFWKWREQHGWKPVALSAATIAAGVLLMALPWLVKNAIIVGNPVAPFFNTYFPNPHVTPAWEKGYVTERRHLADFTRDGRWQDYLEAPLEITVRGDRLQGMIGPVFLIAPICLLAWRTPLARALLGCAVLFGMSWFVNPGVRFLIPAVPFLSLAIGMGFERLPRGFGWAPSTAVIVLHAVLSWPSVMTHWHKATWRVDGLPWRAALRIEPDWAYLTRTVENYPISQAIERFSGGQGRVFSMEQLPEAYMRTEVLVCYQAALNERLFNAILAPIYHDGWPLHTLQFPLPAPALSGLRIAQHASNPESDWILSEIRFKREEEWIDPRPSWRFRSSHGAWTAPAAFDQDHFRMYRSWSPLRDGMWIEVTFPEPLEAEAVEVIYPAFFNFEEMSYEMRDAGGTWVSFSPQVTTGSSRIEVDDLKKRAAAELKRHGVDLLLLNLEGSGHNWIAGDVAKDAANWGFKEIYREGTRRLYRVKPEPAASEPETNRVMGLHGRALSPGP